MMDEILEPFESRVRRDFTLTVERVSDRTRATIEMTPEAGDRRLGRVMDALYWRSKAKDATELPDSDFTLTIEQRGERVRVVLTLVQDSGYDGRLGKVIDALYTQSKLIAS